LPIGPKRDKDIPIIIKEANMEIKRAFLRGLADTDASLTFRKGRRRRNSYPVIDYRTQSLIAHNSILKILRELGFTFHEGRYLSRRNDKIHPINYFQLNGRKQLAKWMQEIGFTNPNQVTRYEVWQKFGFLPPRTTIIDRRKMLNEKSRCY